MNHLEEVFNVCQASNDCVYIEGVHGIGKSQRAERWALDAGVHNETLFLSQMEVGDLIGIPYNTKNEEVSLDKYETKSEEIMYWSTPSWLKRMYDANKAGKACSLFLDEINRAQSDVLQAALQLVLDKQIHEHQLPTYNGVETMIIAAGNPTGDYQTNEMDDALIDRFVGPIEIKPDAEEWLIWARKSGVNNVILKYIAKNPKMIHFSPEDSSHGTSPRAWAKVSTLLDNLGNSGKDNPALYTLLRGRLGRAVGTEFLNFYKNHSDMIGVDDITRAVKSVVKKTNTNAQNLDASYGLIAKLLDNQEQPVINNLVEEVYALSLEKGKWTLLNHLCYGCPIEVATAFITNIKKTDSKNFNTWVKEPTSKEVFARIVKKIKLV